MRFPVALFLLSLFFLSGVKAQETLPGFSVILKQNGKVVVSWKNAYPTINQISIQRSSDSLHNFSTLITVPDPHTPENGVVDSRAQGKRMYYRIFILFGKSHYMFTKSKRAVSEPEPKTKPADVKTKPAEQKPKPVETPVLVKTRPSREKPKPIVEKPAPVAEKPLPAEDSSHAVAAKPPEPPQEEDVPMPKLDNSRVFYLQDTRNLRAPDVNSPSKIKTPRVEVEKTLYVKRRDSLIMQLPGNKVRRFSDSLLKQTKDTLLFVNADTLMIKPYNAPPPEIRDVYKISPYVFTAKDGNVNISLADFNQKKYSVQFFEEDHTPLLEIKTINDKLLIIDKTNFSHSGWFRFELYENGNLVEKNKLFIPKEF